MENQRIDAVINDAFKIDFTTKKVELLTSELNPEIPLNRLLLKVSTSIVKKGIYTGLILLLLTLKTILLPSTKQKIFLQKNFQTVLLYLSKTL